MRGVVAILTDQSLVEEIVPSTRRSIEVIESTDTYGKVVVEPLERGFGVTLGNALRRVLLNSLPGASITWVRIEGVQHEFSTIPHVKEDVAELFLNIKGIRIKRTADRSGALRLDIQGPGQVTAGDIQLSADFEIVNPEQYLASLDSPEGRLTMEFQVEIGKGYQPAARTEGMPIGMLPVDAIFTPVLQVNYNVEKTRVGQVTNYDRLVLELWTDGTKSPVDAVREAGQLLVDSFLQFVKIGQVQGTESDPRLAKMPSIPEEQYNMPIERLNLSARTVNCLKRAKINKVGEVLEKSRVELLKIKNFGEKSLQELYERLGAIGLPSDIQGTEGKMDAAGANAETEEPDLEPASLQAPAAAYPRALREPVRGSGGRGSLRDLSALRALLGAEPQQSKTGDAGSADDKER